MCAVMAVTQQRTLAARLVRDASMATPAAASALRLRRIARGDVAHRLLSGVAFLRRVCQAPDHTARLVTYSGCAEGRG